MSRSSAMRSHKAWSGDASDCWLWVVTVSSHYNICYGTYVKPWRKKMKSWQIFVENAEFVFRGLPSPLCRFCLQVLRCLSLHANDLHTVQLLIEVLLPPFNHITPVRQETFRLAARSRWISGRTCVLLDKDTSISVSTHSVSSRKHFLSLRVCYFCFCLCSTFSCYLFNNRVFFLKLTNCFKDFRSSVEAVLVFYNCSEHFASTNLQSRDGEIWTS